MNEVKSIEDIIELRPEVMAFARLMEIKLRKHDDRPGWKRETPEYLMGLLIEEVDELQGALAHRRGGDTPEGVAIRREEAAFEAADVANFAMMIADVLGGLGPAQ